MRGKYIGILLAVLNLVILGTIVFFHLQKDRVAPEIYAKEITLVYEEGMEEDKLLEGVVATDNKDGDITKEIVIEKVVMDSQKTNVTITYGVADSAGNISKVTRTVDMIVEEDMEMLSEESSSEEENTEEENTEEENTEEENTEEENMEEENTEDSTEVETDADVEEETTSEIEEGSTESEPENERVALPTAGEASNEGSPSIVFRNTKVKAQIGGTPAWVDAIEGLHDDKDDYVKLFESISVQGEYDKNTPGTYSVKITITDSDGNVSSAYPVEIVVE